MTFSLLPPWPQASGSIKEQFSTLLFACQPAPGSFSSSFALSVPSEMLGSAFSGTASTSRLVYFMSQVIGLPSIFLDSSEGCF